MRSSEKRRKVVAIVCKNDLEGDLAKDLEKEIESVYRKHGIEEAIRLVA